MPFDPSSRNEANAWRGASAPESHRPSLSDLDRVLRGRFGAVTGGQSPWAAFQAWEDWAFHLSVSPGRQMELAWQAWQAAVALVRQTGDRPADAWAFPPPHGDRRFRHDPWSRYPYNFLAQTQLAMEAQWRAATDGVRGVATHHQRRVEFMGRFMLNCMAPANFPWSNPEVIDAAIRTGGANFVQGASLLAEDVRRLNNGEKLAGLDGFVVGQTMGATPGEVVFRNELFELIQYAPLSETVHAEPVLIVPAWIMKFYILDLEPEQSLVRYLLENGRTVFIMSWRNPGPDMADTAFDSYRSSGVMAAIDEVCRITGASRIHAAGYCLGGTVLAIAAAAMDRANDQRLKSLTFLAAQTDFEEAGELMMFIDESQLSLLEDMMRLAGYLDSRNMAGAFYALRANEMVFSRFVERYLLGSPPAPSALDAWLADATRMPARMHGEYLRKLFLDNELAHGAFRVGGSVVALKDIHAPVFALGAERDHIAPWQSVQKIQLYGAADTTFVLTGGGHNTSVVSPPGKPGAYYYAEDRPTQCPDDYLDADAWLARAGRRDGSWWPEWLAWLGRNSSGRLVAPPVARRRGREPRVAAPGQYVHLR